MSATIGFGLAVARRGKRDVVDSNRLQTARSEAKENQEFLRRPLV